MIEIIVSRIAMLAAWMDGVLAIMQSVAETDAQRAVQIHQRVYMPLAGEYIKLTPALGTDTVARTIEAELDDAPDHWLDDTDDCYWMDLDAILAEPDIPGFPSIH